MNTHTDDAAALTVERPVLVVALHGILTGSTSVSWAHDYVDWAGAHHDAWGIWYPYYEIPLPRLAAIRNKRRADEIVAHVRGHVEELYQLFAMAPSIRIVGHSNGGVLALWLARHLIADDWTVDALCLTAPALRTKAATREIADWIDAGKLGRATLIRATRDRLLKWVGLAPRLVSWPWGSLGHDGWDAAEMERRGRNLPMAQMDVDARHSDFLSPENRATTFALAIDPALGFPPAGEVLMSV